MEETISLKELFETIKKRILMIVVIVAVAVAASGLVSYLILTPVYQSSTQLLVNQSRTDQQAYTQGDIRTNIELINTYNVIIESPIILDKVIKELNLSKSAGDLNSQISVGSEKNSQVLFISVQDPDPALAVQITNTVATVFQKEIVSIMNVDNVGILSEAKLAENPAPIKPNPKLNMAIAFVVGLMTAVGLAFLLEFLDNTIKTEKDVENYLGIAVIGVIPPFEVDSEQLQESEKGRRNKRGENIARRKRRENQASTRNLIAKVDPKSPVSEQYRTLRSNLQFASIDRELRTIMVTSSNPGEGKSTTIANLAVVLAQQGNRVLLIDADMRKPSVHYTFQCPNTQGLTSVLTKQASLEEAVYCSAVENLTILTSGPIPPNPSELLSSKAMDLLLTSSRGVYDILLLDTPPILAVTDAQVLANICDGVVLVINSGKTEVDHAIKAKDLLINMKAKLLGVVLNQKEAMKNDNYYYYGEK